MSAAAPSQFGDKVQPHRVGLLLAGLALLVATAHLPLRHGEYVQDDELAVERNEIVERGGLDEIFTTSYWEGARGADRTLYRPIVIASYALEQRLAGGASAPVSRGVNVALHILVTFALLLLARRLGFTEPVALAAAALFAVHPIHVEAVANVVGRAELLAALFSLCALYALTWTGPRDLASGLHPRRASAAAGLTGVFVFLALGSKEIAIATPFVLAGLTALYARPGDWRRAGWWIDRSVALGPTVLAGLVYLGFRVNALELLVSLQEVHVLDNLLVDLHGVPRLATALSLVTRYATLLFYPLHLANDYSGSVIAIQPSLLRLPPLLGIVLLAACAAPILAALTRRLTAAAEVSVTPSREPNDDAALSPRDRVALAALLLLLPYAVIGNLFFTVGAALAERFMYLPSVGFCLLLTVALDALGRSFPAGSGRRMFLGIVGMLVLAFALQTFARSLEWRDNRTVFEAAARVNPQSPRAHFVLGKLTLDAGDPDGAVEHLDRTLELRPDHPTAWLEKGNARAAQGRFSEAEALFRETLRHAPTYATAHRNLALALRRQGRLAEAERALQKAALWRPGSATTWAEMGNQYLQLRRFADAAMAYRRAIELGRTDLAERLALAERGAAGL